MFIDRVLEKKSSYIFVIDLNILPYIDYFISVPNDRPFRESKTLNPPPPWMDYLKAVPWSVDLERLYCMYMWRALFESMIYFFFQILCRTTEMSYKFVFGIINTILGRHLSRFGKELFINMYIYMHTYIYIYLYIAHTYMSQSHTNRPIDVH